MKNEICPKCGNIMIDGFCLDCGYRSIENTEITTIGKTKTGEWKEVD